MNTLKYILALTILSLGLTGGLWLASVERSRTSNPPPISRLQAMSDLATVRVQISDTMTGENDHWLVRWILNGEAVLGIDLSQAIYTSTDVNKREATLSLPSPHVISHKVDHRRSSEMSVQQKTLVPSPGLKRLRETVWERSDEKISQRARHDGYSEATKQQAVRALGQLFREGGWDLSVEWKPDRGSGLENPPDNHFGD